MKRKNVPEIPNSIPVVDFWLIPLYIQGGILFYVQIKSNSPVFTFETSQYLNYFYPAYWLPPQTQNDETNIYPNFNN